MNPELLKCIREKLRILETYSPQAAHWSPAAAKIWDGFYRKIENGERKGLLGAATKRVHVYVRKLAMVYAGLEGTLPEIADDQLAAAIEVGWYGVRAAERLLESQALRGQPQGELEKRMLTYVTERPGIRKRYMQQCLNKHFGNAEVFNRVFQNLVVADQIEVTVEKRVYRTAG